MALALAAVARTDRGLVRSVNEDCVFASPRMAVVADGVGGSAAGEVASAVAMNELILMDKSRLSGPLDEALADAVRSANASVGFVAEAQPPMAGMSTTLTAVALGPEGFAIANVGDSRAYLLRGGELAQLTRDDSYVQELIDAGALYPAEARSHPQRSVVLAALDGDPGRAPTLGELTALRGDRLLLCSDGLTDFVEETEIAVALALASREESAQQLLELALGAGGRDNISVVVADVVEGTEPLQGWLPARGRSARPG